MSTTKFTVTEFQAISVIIKVYGLSTDTGSQLLNGTPFSVADTEFASLYVGFTVVL